MCDPQTPKEFKVEMEETREVNIETVTTVISNIQDVQIQGTHLRHFSSNSGWINAPYPRRKTKSSGHKSHWTLTEQCIVGDPTAVCLCYFDINIDILGLIH